MNGIEMTGGPTELTDGEFVDRERIEARVRSIGCDLEAIADDLLLFKEARLFRSSHRSWGAWVRDVCPFCKRTADRYVAWAQLRNGTPGSYNEKQGRPLVSLEPEDRERVAERIMDRGGWEAFTAKDVAAVVEEVVPSPPRSTVLATTSQGTGPLDLADTGFVPDLDKIGRLISRHTSRGVHYVPDVMAALDADDRAAVIKVALAARDFLAQVLADYDHDSPPQQSWTFRPRGDLPLVPEARRDRAYALAA